MSAPKKPQDHLAKAEAQSDDLVIEHNGVTYQIDRDNADNLELLELIEDEKYITAIKGYVGEEQWAKFKDANRDDKGRVRSTHFETFLQAVMGAIGGGSGNSQGSATS